MDGFYNNGGNTNYSGYSNRTSNNNYGSCCNCPGGNCPRMADQSQCGCPGGNCCPGGRCSIRGSRSSLDWQNNGR